MTLDARKTRILGAVVEGYVESGEPIGSAWLAAHFDFGCKPATLRNEMAELSEYGYLVQPHTSAGRVPSRQGYRYYVDEVIPTQTGAAEEPVALASYRPDEFEVEEIVQQTCRLLADMTQCAGVASPPARTVTKLHRLYVTPASERHALLVVLLSTGDVQHRLLEAEEAGDAGALQRVSNYLNARLSGVEMADVLHRSLGEAPGELQPHAALVARIHRAVADIAKSIAQGRLFLEGAGHILRQREFQNVLRLEQLLLALEERSALFDVFSAALQNDGVTVMIGVESTLEAMRDCSVIASPYRVGDRHGGFIGVLGPTRMRYNRNMACVGQLAQSLSAVLAHASLS